MSVNVRLHHDSWTGALSSLSTTCHHCFYLHTDWLHHRSSGFLAGRLRYSCGFHSTWRKLYSIHANEGQIWSAFARTCRSSERWYSSGQQSTVAAVITSRTILDLTSHSLVAVATGFAATHCGNSHSSLLHQNAASVRDPTPAGNSSILMRRYMSPLSQCFSPPRYLKGYQRI